MFQNSFVLKRSPGSINASRARSAEDLLSDTASVNSDVSDSSFNTSLQGKRCLPAPSKVNVHMHCISFVNDSDGH